MLENHPDYRLQKKPEETEYQERKEATQEKKDNRNGHRSAKRPDEPGKTESQELPRIIFQNRQHHFYIHIRGLLQQETPQKPLKLKEHINLMNFASRVLV